MTRRLTQDERPAPQSLGGKARSIGIAAGPDTVDVVTVDQDELAIWWRRWTRQEGWAYQPAP